MNPNGKYAVMIMHDPEAHKTGKPVPRFALTPDGMDVRMFDKYKEADSFKQEMKASYPMVWLAITKVYLPIYLPT